jgi:hypothetical protein
MDFEVPVVVYVAQLPKLVHEEAHAGARRVDHVRERLLADLRDYRLMLPVLAEVRQQEQSPRQSFLAGIKQLVDQVLFHPQSARQKMRHE